MPFGTTIENGKRIGPTAWIKKAIEEQARGNTTVIVWPMDGWFHMLLEAGAEIRTLGEVKWLATEDGTPQKGSSRKTVMFVLRGAAPCESKTPPQKSNAAVPPSDSDSSSATVDSGSKPIENNRVRL
jgi:hypothetical protein